MVRHYTWLSQRNFGIDTGFYPLGSCTMKHNPRVNEAIAQMPGITDIHPLQPVHHLQGLLAIYHEMQEMLSICAGMDAVTLQPVAGAQGEFTAIRCIQEYHRHRGEGHRSKVIVPDNAHGTNPASAAMAGYDIIEIPSGADGRLDLDALRAVVGEDTLRDDDHESQHARSLRTGHRRSIGHRPCRRWPDVLRRCELQCDHRTHQPRPHGLRCGALQSSQDLQPASRWRGPGIRAHRCQVTFGGLPSNPPRRTPSALRIGPCRCPWSMVVRVGGTPTVHRQRSAVARECWRCRAMLGLLQALRGRSSPR